MNCASLQRARDPCGASTIARIRNNETLSLSAASPGACGIPHVERSSRTSPVLRRQFAMSQ
eukprot:11765527-Alexandrium_andersonii.AAC.1